MNLQPESTDLHGGFLRIVAFAEKVFASKEKSMYWLHMEDDRLGDKTPWEVLATAEGQRSVESILWQIDEGMYG